MQMISRVPAAQRRVQAILAIFERHPRLLSLLFREDVSDLVASPRTLVQKTKCLSSGEQVLCRLALDIWCGTDDVRVSNLDRLDDENFRDALKALHTQRFGL